MVEGRPSRDKARTEFLVTAAAAVASSLDADELLAQLTRQAVPTIADWCAIDLIEDGRVRRAAVGHPDSVGREIAMGWWQRFPVTDPGNQWIVDLANTRKASGVVNVTEAVLATIQNEEMVGAIRALHVRQALVVPLVTREHFFGALTMAMANSDRIFEIEDARLCEELGHQIAGALENARLYSAELKARRRETKLHSLTAALSKAATSAEVAEVTCRLGADASDAPTGALWLLEASGTLVLAYHWGAATELVARFERIGRESRLPPQVAVRSGVAQWIETEADYRRDAPAIADRAAAAGRLESFAAVPLKVGPRVLGVFAVSYRGWRKFSTEERALFVTMAEHSGQAIERVLLHEALERRAARDRFLSDLSLAIAPAVSDLPAMFETAIHLCVDALSATCVLRIISQDAQSLDEAAIWSHDPATMERIRATLGSGRHRTDEGLCGRAIRERRLISADEATTDASVARDLRELAAGGHVSAAMCAPLVSRGAVIGTITSIRHAPSPAFDAEDAILLREAGIRLAMAIDRARLLEAAQRSARQADEASRMKDEFLATVSHELRTPLNAILGWSTLLRKEGVTFDRERKGLEVIHRNAQAQARLIDDILDVSRIITGKLRIDPKAVDLVAIAEQAIDVITASAAAKRVALSFAPAGPILVMADPSRVQQVLWNLLSNAIKFTPVGGRVALSIRVDGPSVAIEVTDTGRGIDKEFLPSVFDRFRQADSSTTRELGGVGLGLAIVRHIVELHGGSVEAESAGPGRGAKFRVLLPTTASSSETARRAPQPASGEPNAFGAGLPGVRVLVVDDEPDARDLMQEILSAAGASVRVESSAKSALDSLGVFRPDVLVSDIAMPGRDGYSLMRQIRSRGIEQQGDVPSLALSAYTRSEDRAAAFAAGYMAHLGKPVNPPDLIAAVAKLAHRVA